MSDGHVGRTLLVKRGSTVIAGLRNATITVASESINVTSGEDDGKQLLLAASGEDNVGLSAEGIMKSGELRDIMLGAGSKMLTDITLEWPLSDSGSTPASLAVNFRISNYEEGRPYNDAITFSATFESSGDWTYTAEA
jgi:predicted secreted protein